MVLTHVKIGSGEVMGLFRETETNSWAVVWGWGVSWARSYKDLKSRNKEFGLMWEEGKSHRIQLQGQGHTLEMEGLLLIREHSSVQRVYYTLVVAVNSGFAFFIMEKIMHAKK